MKNVISVCELESEVLPSGAEGSTVYMAIVVVPVMVIIGVYLQ